LQGDALANLTATIQCQSWPLVSVVVPFYGVGIDQLCICLAALNDQSYPVDLAEIIVVDNNASAILSADSLPAGRPWRLAHQPKAGSYAARNVGISLAKGKVIAFTDADCRPDKD